MIAALGAAWYLPWVGLVRQVGSPGSDSHDSWLEGLNQAAAARDVRNASGRQIRFIASPNSGMPKPCAINYEAGIADCGAVPTRTRGVVAWHDYFNALVWLMFPLTKAAINQRQAAVIAAEGISGTRGSLRDALTLFDESAVLFVSPDASQYDDLKEFRWSRLFVERRAEFAARTHCVVFGHALLQKLLNPYKAICGHCVGLNGTLSDPASADPLRRRGSQSDITPDEHSQALTIADMDSRLARWIVQRSFGKQMLTPLPVLGVPGWWRANESPEFYNDPDVFRRPRK